MLHFSASTAQHKDLQQSRIARDEADVKSLVAIMEECWINPFKVDLTELICLSSGKLPTPEIEKDLLQAKAIGDNSFKTFSKERLESDPPIIKFHEPLKKQKLKTFVDLTRKVQLRKASGKEVIIKADRALFAQMTLIAENRKLQISDVLCHPLGPLP